MSTMPLRPFSVTPDALLLWGRLVLGSGLVAGLVLIAYLAWAAPDLLLGVPALLLVPLLLTVLFRHPLLNLGCVLFGVLLILDYEAGIQITEILYGLYFVGFLTHWFVTRLFIYETRVLETTVDKALFIFLIGMTLSLGLSLLYGARVTAAFSEWISLALLGFYFPIKEACRRYRHGVLVVLGALALVGLFIALRNLVNYQEVLLSATEVYHITRGRVVTNDGPLMACCLFFLVFLIFARTWPLRFILLGSFLATFASLILTQSRGYWAAFGLGAIVMFFMVSGRYKRRLVILGIAGLLGALGIGALFFSEYLDLIVGGLLERFGTLRTAAQDDMSLVNRFRETAAAWSYIEQNPILGHGPGVTYEFFDIAHGSNDNDSFIHNGYVGLMFKFGIWGLGLVLVYWLGATWRAVRVFRRLPVPRLHRVAALAAALILIAFMLSNLTSNAFFLNDTLFIIAVATGLAGGVHPPAEPSPQT